MKDSKKKKKSQAVSLDQKCQEYLLGWQRAQADYENLKKESESKIEQLGSLIKTNLLSDLIPIVDNFEQATAHVPENQQKEGWVVGIFQIKRQLEEFLKENGLEKIETVGQKFDPLLHEAVGQEKSEKKDIIIKQVSSGYQYQGKTIVPAKVIVGY